MPRWRRRYFPLLLLLGLPFVHLAGCAGPAYYAQAIGGHLKLMRARVPVSELLADPATDPATVQQLRLAERIRQFAQQELHLGESGSFTRFAATGREAVTWNVLAAQEFSVEPRLWCFPVAGCVPYRGYFQFDRAQKFAAKLRAEGYDVAISPAVAYSTLGWFEDPLLDTMFQYSETQLAAVMFHELAHEKLFVKGDAAFSESFAGYVEQVGIGLWLTAIGRAGELSQREQRNRATAQFQQLLRDTRKHLEQVYASDRPEQEMRQEKQLIIQRMQTDYQQRVKHEWNGVDYFSNWMSETLNNAHLALITSYEGGSCAFLALYQMSGRNLERFYQLAREKADLGSERRAEWLAQPCSEFASADDL